jgi:hypothetical protein
MFIWSSIELDTEFLANTLMRLEYWESIDVLGIRYVRIGA